MSYPRCIVLAALFGCSSGTPANERHPSASDPAPRADIVADEIEVLERGARPDPVASARAEIVLDDSDDAGDSDDSDDAGRRLGRYQLTYYHVARQKTSDRSPAVALRDKRGKVLARVSRAYSKRLQMQGTGRLTDGRLINVAGGCRKTKRCYHIVADNIEWGIGARNRPLRPFRSVAAPPHIRFGTVLYIPELDGLPVPGGMANGRYIHDGCVVADDRGGGIKGRQLDLFTADGDRYRLFHRKNRLVRVTVHEGGDRCSDLAQAPEAPRTRDRG